MDMGRGRKVYSMKERGQLIPKYIHYCWFGPKEIPEIGKKCIESWKKNMPDYTIICWSEKNFDVESNDFTKKAYRDGQYAFVSDYVRLKALYDYGGIYMDIDEEVLKNFDDLLEDKEIVACFENNQSVMVGLLAAAKASSLIKTFLERYHNIEGEVKYIANPVIFTELLQKEKNLKLTGQYQELDHGRIAIFPNEYFCGYDFSVYKDNITANTYAIQRYAGTWTNGKSMRSKKAHELLVNCVGERNYLRIKKIWKWIKRC